MKRFAKVIALAVCAVLLVAGSVMGTMAWLTSRATVTNTFTVGQVSITMDEKNVDGKDAAGNDNSSLTRDTANKYALVPCKTYVKDPTIHVSVDSEECYLFVKVVNGVANLEPTGEDSIIGQMTSLGWSKVDGTEDVYVYQETVKKTTTDRDIEVFGNFTVRSDIEKIEDSYASATIEVYAYAVQADGFGTAQAAWEAAESQFTNS